MKRTICCLAALVLLLLSAVSFADKCEHPVRPSEWVLAGYVDPQPGVPGYSGDLCCPLCGTVLQKGEPIDALPMPDDKEEQGTEQEDPVPVPVPVNIGAETPESPAAPVSVPAFQSPGSETEREHFSEQYPFQWIKMNPEPGIEAPAAGELIWSPDMDADNTPEASNPFSFRNGITFGMTREEIIRTEASNGEIKEDEWVCEETPGWLIMIPGTDVQVSDYTARLTYYLANDQLQMAIYGFVENNEAFSVITEALSVVYGQGQAIPQKAIIDLMKKVDPEIPYEEKDIQSVLDWEPENVTIYQFCYADVDYFAVVYTNPAFDYAQVSEPRPVNTTGL